ncbi:hypothetical protein F2Q70_00018608 [Brassica cretica]|uniref:Uncharacterized protein n=1 Tax=Brassica cretica TaxID=69181 RepID=A0A8S9I376_BRACR|nr:hypothetical protein F2Q70_00018608 [Brassica cretica]
MKRWFLGSSKKEPVGLCTIRKSTREVSIDTLQVAGIDSEGLNDEANFYGFYIQEGVQDNWNRDKVFTEQEVMNFTSQRFLIPSICEYPTLEEDSSPMKNRPEEKPIIGVKRSLSSLQKAQDQEK